MSIVWYWRCKGKELLYAIYIPLDILLNVAVVSFFWLEYFRLQAKKKKKKEKAQKLAAITKGKDPSQTVLGISFETLIKEEKNKK